VANEPARTTALGIATRTLARREHSERSLRERLQRAGVAPDDAEAVVEELRHAGLVDDGRFAEVRARVLAEGGKGDAAIRFELERAGVDAAQIEVALGGLDPERERAAALVARRGATPATARLLAGRGFDQELVATLVAQEP
jgi:regulatory protein